MTKLMRCSFCGLLQDEPVGVKTCQRCGGELDFDPAGFSGEKPSYVQVQMELDQVAAPADQNTERYLLLTISTPKEVPPKDSAPPGKKRPPLNFTPVVDVSGSMAGGKLSQAKLAVRQSLNYLHDEDFFSMVTFSDEIKTSVEPVRIQPSVIADIQEALKGVFHSGMTNLAGGLKLGITKSKKKIQDTNLVLLLSDGQTNVGETDLEKIGMIAKKARKNGLTVSTIGIGRDYNEALLVEISNQGGGRFYHIMDESKIPGYVAGELGEAAYLAAKDTRITLDIPKGATLVPLSIAYPVVQNGNKAMVELGDIPCDTELEIPLRLALLPQKPGSKLSIIGSMEFTSPAGNEHKLNVNRVTIRFKKQKTFEHREGLVEPVAEKIFVQLKASSLLRVNRTRTHRPDEMDKEARRSIDNLRNYASKLGKERSDREMREVEQDYHNLSDSVFAKTSSQYAQRVQRGSKDFDKK
ncbi:VWA domain-containing protein [Chloroflexota bacterium]